MAVNGKKLALGIMGGFTAILIIGGLAGIMTLAMSGASTEASEPTTIEGNAATGAAVGEAVPASDPAASECNFSEWVGQTAPAAEVAAKATGRPYRILTPGSAMTMDYRADRINVELDDNAVVTKVSCG